MTTVRQMEKLWTAKSYQKLLRDMLALRVEGAFVLEAELNVAPASAAAALIRLSELGQSHVPLTTHLVRFLLASQHADGSWGDAMTTALCLRALMIGHGQGVAIERALAFLGNLQREDGLWPKIPIRRLPGDPLTSAFVLQQLGADPRFHEQVRAGDTLNWFEANARSLDDRARKQWTRATVRCQAAARKPSTQPVLVWS